VRISTPRDAVELDVVLADLVRRRVNGEEIETFDLVLARANAAELPVPQNLGAASDEDLVGGDVAVRGRLGEDVGDEGLLAAGGDATELRCALAV